MRLPRLTIALAAVVAGLLLPCSATAADVEGFIYGPTMNAERTVGHVDNMTAKWTCATFEPDCTWQPFATLFDARYGGQCSPLSVRAWRSSTQTGSGTVASGALGFNLWVTLLDTADTICLYVLYAPGTQIAADHKLTEATLVALPPPPPLSSSLLTTGQRSSALKKCQKKFKANHDKKKFKKCKRKAKELPV